MSDMCEYMYMWVTCVCDMTTAVEIVIVDPVHCNINGWGFKYF